MQALFIGQTYIDVTFITDHIPTGDEKHVADAYAISFMLGNAETKVLLTDREVAPTIAAALEKVESKPLVIDVLDSEYTGPGDALGSVDYEALLASGDPDYAWQPPADEWNAIALNYTSGTTGNPK